MTRRRTTAQLTCLLALGAGCGAPPGTVSGTVTYQGKAVTGGSVVLYSAGKQLTRGVIGADGRYSIPNAPRGPAVVTVLTHARLPAGMQMKQPLPPSTGGPVPPGAERAGRAGPPVAVPARYAVPEESGLAVMVDRDQVSYDIDLTP